MVGDIYFVEIPYSDYSYIKGRPVLIFKSLENDYLFLPLTSNLKRAGILLKNTDLSKGVLKKDSVVVVPKISAIDKKLIFNTKFIAAIKIDKFNLIMKELCSSLECI
jgi:mRNA-degrading endonuclease toxin of MazEF toxin-antitoxin module